MKNLRNLLPAIIIMIMSFSTMRATDFKNESLNYIISYKWGLIHKDAGKAQLSLINKGDKFEIKLIGISLPWVDKFYSVRDTLLSSVLKREFKPLSYTKIAREDGKISRDDITYQYSGNIVGCHAIRTRIDKKGNKKVDEKQLSGPFPAYDMLSVFYFLRTLDYKNLSINQTITTTLFSGVKVETLSIRLVGTTRLKLRDKSYREAYHIKFRFTSGGKKKSSEDIDAWISTDEPHIPLQIVGSLPVGQVKCYYIPN